MASKRNRSGRARKQHLGIDGISAFRSLTRRDCTDSLLHRIFEGDALRIVLIKPSLRGLFGGKHLQMVDVAGQRVGVDVDPDRFHRSSPRRAFPRTSA